MKLSALRCLLLALVFPCCANRVAWNEKNTIKSNQYVIRSSWYPLHAEKGNKCIHAKSLRLEPTYMSLNIVTYHHHGAHFLGKVAEPFKKTHQKRAPVEQRLESWLRKVKKENSSWVNMYQILLALQWTWNFWTFFLLLFLGGWVYVNKKNLEKTTTFRRSTTLGTCVRKVDSCFQNQPGG